MTTPLQVLAGGALFALGLFAWSLGEYVLHRFAMHELKGKGMASREHLRHHAQRDSVLESWYYAWTGIVIVGLVMGATSALVLGPLGWLFGVGWVVAYGLYDLLHWRAHRRPATNPYERWLRRHHFHHHFGHPNANHGVTSPLWDIVFGTYERVDGPVRVPRRLAMVWLVDEHGAVRPEHAADYALAGRLPWTDEQAKVDHRRAFANLAPEA